MQQAGLQLKKSKCVFMSPSVEYLGYVIDKDGLHPSQQKVKAVKNAPRPNNTTELKVYVGQITVDSREELFTTQEGGFSNRVWHHEVPQLFVLTEIYHTYVLIINPYRVF